MRATHRQGHARATICVLCGVGLCLVGGVLLLTRGSEPNPSLVSMENDVGQGTTPGALHGVQDVRSEDRGTLRERTGRRSDSLGVPGVHGLALDDSERPVAGAVVCAIPFGT